MDSSFFPVPVSSISHPILPRGYAPAELANLENVTLTIPASALRDFFIEASILLTLSFLVILLRVSIRIRHVGFRGLHPDDYLMMLVIIPFTTEVALAYVGGDKYGGLLNSGMSDGQRANLSPDNPEHHKRYEHGLTHTSLAKESKLTIYTESEAHNSKFLAGAYTSPSYGPSKHLYAPSTSASPPVASATEFFYG